MTELIDHTITGFVVDSADEAIAAVTSAAGLNRQAIRQRTVSRFGIDRMVTAYLDVYRRVLLGER